jgi:hypothetical protein
MRFKGLLLSSILLVIGLLIVSNSVARACGPVDFDASAETIWCDARTRLPTPIPTPLPVQIADLKPASPTIQRTGDSPQNALEISDNTFNLNPGGRLWFQIGADGSHMDVWMTTYGQPGVGFAVYAPNQDLNAPETRPKGVGSYTNSDPNTLRWSGGSFTQKGVWIALVTNDGTKPVSFKLSSNQTAVNKNCFSYGEFYPNGSYVTWTECDRPQSK